VQASRGPSKAALKQQQLEEEEGFRLDEESVAYWRDQIAAVAK
jgi:hypothetical protein